MPLTPSARTRLALLALLLLGLALRLFRLDMQALWWDEGYSVWFAHQDLAAMLRLTAQDIHPPLYYALLHVWALVLGLEPVMLRLFSVLASQPAIVLAYLLGRDLPSAAGADFTQGAPRRGSPGRGVGLLAAALVAFNPLAIYYSQEIRMYGLAATCSLAALWTGWRWAQPGASRRFGIGYALSVLAGLYTLYYFALLPLAQTVWVLFGARRRLRPWLAATLAAGLLYLPWLLYAGPRLLDYVAYKVVQDNDTPLPLLQYMGRHLSAFVAGHLEGPLGALWPWALVLLVPPALALLLFAVSQSVSDRHGRTGTGTDAIGFLLLILVLILAVGFVQQVRAPFIPDRFERVLLFAAPALWLLLALGLHRLGRVALPAALLTGLLLIGVQAGSLAVLYTTPRYPERDYRPLIREVQRQGRPGDSVFTIFPWQTGYFWAYWPADYPVQVAAAVEPEWTPAVQQQLDDLLAGGAVWFPEHLALGAILESAVEDYLDRRSYQIVNRWYGEETRLTGWAQASALDVAGSAALVAPIAWQNGVTLAAGWLAPAAPEENAGRLFFDLDWMGAQAVVAADWTFSLWLAGPDGSRWTQRDVNPFAHPWPPLEPGSGQQTWSNRDRIALTLPAGTPPGEYDLFAALLDRAGAPVAVAGPSPAPQAWLASVTLPAGPEARAGEILPDFPTSFTSAAIEFLGHDRPDGLHLPGDDVPISLYWRPRTRLDVDLSVFVQLIFDRVVVAGLEGPPVPWYATGQWLPGAALRSQHLLRLPAQLPAGEYDLIAGLFDPATGERPVWDGADYLRLGRVRVGARTHSYQLPQPQHLLDLTLAGGHTLLGYDLVAGDRPGSPINLTLYWAPAGATERRYSTFVHLLAPDSDILAQSDGEPDRGAHPTTSWLAGEYVADAHTLALPAADVAGPYRLVFGLYDPITAERVPFVGPDGAILSDHAQAPAP